MCYYALLKKSLRCGKIKIKIEKCGTRDGTQWWSVCFRIRDVCSSTEKSKRCHFIESRYKNGNYFCTLTCFKLSIIKNESLVKRLRHDKHHIKA